MTRAAFSAVRFALRRAQHRADLRRRRSRDIGPKAARLVACETAECGGDPVLQLVQQLMPSFGVAGDQGFSHVGEGVGEQGEGDTARRCFESFSAFLHANPHQHVAVGEKVALGGIQASGLDPDPIGSFAAALQQGLLR